MVYFCHETEKYVEWKVSLFCSKYDFFKQYLSCFS
uniref:Uncharacterized protein n=1 Tax=Anguilla anguilla TaxID=7936 RepID=A0A0E9UNH4_ANGAN